MLKYFKKPQDTVPKGVIHLEGYQVSDGDDAIKKSFAIMITKDGFRFDSPLCSLRKESYLILPNSLFLSLSFTP